MNVNVNINVKCANCSRELPQGDLKEGWCGSCGKEIPMFVYHGAGLKGPERHVLSRAEVSTTPAVAAEIDRDDNPPVWKLAIIGLVVLSIAAAIVYSLA
jgi:hypothetical protein